MRSLTLFRIAAVAAAAALLAAPAEGFIIRPSDPDPWLSTASGPRSGNGAPGTITWSIVPDGTSVTKLSGVGSSSSNLISFMNSNFGGSSSQHDLTKQPWFHIFDESFGRWEQLSGVDYKYESHDDGVFHPSSNGQLGVRGDIRIGGIAMDGASGTLAFTYFPTGGSDMAIDTGDASFFKVSANNFINMRDTVMHEIGHSFGLEHVNTTTSNLLMEPIINTSFDGPQLDEVRGVQFYFGDANEKSNGGQGNGTTALATSLGTIAGGTTKSIGTAANVPSQAIGPSASDFVSIANMDDVDFYSFSVSQPSRLSATLTPRGGVFTQGGDGETPTTFDANARNNLGLTLFASDGTSALTTADANLAGAVESFSNQLLTSGGTYYTRISGADDTIQLYELSLSVVTLPSGDYNFDGIVDAADYTLWRNSVGQTGVGLPADGNGDHQIDLADFGIWKTHYGEAAGSGASTTFNGTGVPEPTSILLTLIAAIMALMSRNNYRGGDR